MIFKRAVLIDRLEATGKELADYVARFSQDEIHTPPGPGAWNVHQVAAHMRDTEQQVFLLRSQRVLKEEHPTIASWSQEEWSRDHYDADEPLDKIIAEFKAARRTLIRLLRQASPADWEDWACHATLGKLSLGLMAVFNYSHSLEHLAQLIDIHEKALLQSLNNQ